MSQLFAVFLGKIMTSKKRKGALYNDWYFKNKLQNWKDKGSFSIEYRKPKEYDNNNQFKSVCALLDYLERDKCWMCQKQIGLNEFCVVSHNLGHDDNFKLNCKDLNIKSDDLDDILKNCVGYSLLHRECNKLHYSDENDQYPRDKLKGSQTLWERRCFWEVIN